MDATRWRRWVERLDVPVVFVWLGISLGIYMAALDVIYSAGDRRDALWFAGVLAPLAVGHLTSLLAPSIRPHLFAISAVPLWLGALVALANGYPYVVPPAFLVGAGCFLAFKAPRSTDPPYRRLRAVVAHWLGVTSLLLLFAALSPEDTGPVTFVLIFLVLDFVATLRFRGQRSATERGGNAMAAWAEFAAARPEMAAVLTEVLDWIPIAYLATVRRDGSPRLHPVVPVFADGRLLVAVPATSPKRFDLRNDGRYALHALPGERDDEFYLTGRAHLTDDPETRAQVVAAANHYVADDDWLFELAIDLAMTAYWENRGQPDTHAVRQVWHAPSSTTPS